MSWPIRLTGVINPLWDPIERMFIVPHKFYLWPDDG
jgi:hypothetical protein